MYRFNETKGFFAAILVICSCVYSQADELSNDQIKPHRWGLGNNKSITWNISDDQRLGHSDFIEM
ncbi:MAG TPA: hypothetical protein PLP05_06405, partial [Sedimentisphaerales bacterium]|nr:hypothetical protein [Sedimentisphaerales bacterium]